MSETTTGKVIGTIGGGKTLEQSVAEAAVPGPFPTRAEMEGAIEETVAAARGRGDGGTLGVEEAVPGLMVKEYASGAEVAVALSGAMGVPVVHDEANPGTFTATPVDVCDHGVSLAVPCSECGSESRLVATLTPETDLGDDAGTGGSGVAIENQSTIPTIAIDLSTDAPAPVDVPPGRDTTRVLVCSLTAEQRAERGVELAQKLDELASAQDELKTIGDIKRKHIKKLEDDVDRLKVATLDMTESRETPVREVRDYKTGTVKFYRMDTCQEVTSLLRQMTAAEKDEERQVPLFSEGGNATVGNEAADPASGGAVPSDADGTDTAEASTPETDDEGAGGTGLTAETVKCAGGCGADVSTSDDPEAPADASIYLGSNRYACSDACADKADAAEQAETGGEA